MKPTLALFSVLVLLFVQGSVSITWTICSKLGDVPVYVEWWRTDTAALVTPPGRFKVDPSSCAVITTSCGDSNAGANDASGKRQNQLKWFTSCDVSATSILASDDPHLYDPCQYASIQVGRFNGVVQALECDSHPKPPSPIDNPIDDGSCVASGGLPETGGLPGSVAAADATTLTCPPSSGSFVALRFNRVRTRAQHVRARPRTLRHG